MNIGFSLSNNQGLTDVQDVVRIAARAEELGYDSVWPATMCSMSAMSMSASAGDPTMTR